MIYETQAELRDRIEAVANRPVRGEVPILEDTTNYMTVASGTVLRLGGDDYFVTGEATEGRFGIGDQPKYWVKYAFDLERGDRKIVKLVFLEEFTVALGLFTVRCVRDPDKESRVLEVARGDPRFMQGRTLRDRVGNNVRVIDFIKGRTLFDYVARLEEDYETYLRQTLPGILSKVVGCIEALAFLQGHGLQHGDVRNDHIIIESGTGRYRWIDFDYEVNFQDFDVWSVGNILTYVVGKGLRTCQEAAAGRAASGSAEGAVGEEDALVFFRHRLANLRKLHPAIPVELNAILMRFSRSTARFYESLGDIARDLRTVLASGALGSTADEM